MDCKFEVSWSIEAYSNFQEILEYLSQNWTEKEVQSFKSRLVKLLDIISQNPNIFPVSNYHPNIRKALLSKQP